MTYDFWGEEKKYYATFFSRIFQEDLRNVRNELTKRIGNPSSWLDIGSGDGGVLKEIHEKAGGKLTCIEPSDEAVKELKKQLPHATIREEAFSLQTNIEKYEVITLMHATYFFEGDYEKILKKLLSSLLPGGKLIILATSEEGDFQPLGDTPHPQHLLAEQTYGGLKKLTSATVTPFPTRVDVTDYITKHTQDVTESLFHFLRFVKHKNTIPFSEERIEQFRKNIKKLAVKEGEKYVLDFKDCIIEANI